MYESEWGKTLNAIAILNLMPEEDAVAALAYMKGMALDEDLQAEYFGGGNYKRAKKYFREAIKNMKEISSALWVSEVAKQLIEDQ